jgi:hypothetical protein
MTPPTGIDKHLTVKMVETYAKAVDAFLRQLGITESDNDVSFVEYNNNPSFREIRRGGKLLGTIFYGIEPSRSGGVQFVVRCTPHQADTRQWR